MSILNPTPAPVTIRDFFLNKMRDYGLIFARVESYERQNGIALVGRVLRWQNLYQNVYAATQSSQLSFTGSGGAFGECTNFSGEVGYLMLKRKGDSIGIASWHGHIPVIRDREGFWCLLYGITFDRMTGIPEDLQKNSKPSLLRKTNDGKPVDTLVKLDIFDAFILDVVRELDGKAPQVLELIAPDGWLRAQPMAE